MAPYLQLATDFPDVLALMIPIIALTIPIVAIWTKHKYSLEELRLKRHGETSKLAEDVEGLRNDVRELRDQLHQQLIAMDSLLSTPQRGRQSEEIQTRFGAGNE
jgi:hypothetical protein